MVPPECGDGVTFGSMWIELLDIRAWATRLELASAIFGWIVACYNPARHSWNIPYLQVDTSARSATAGA